MCLFAYNFNIIIPTPRSPPLILSVSKSVLLSLLLGCLSVSALSLFISRTPGAAYVGSVEMAMYKGQTSALDIVVVVLIGVGGAAMIVGNIVILCNRGYRPIKAKSVPLTLLSSVGGIIWIVAALVVNDHFARKNGSGLDVCFLWTYWLQVCFGSSLWLNCLTLRLISLYRIFICKRDSTLDYYFLIPLLAPAIGVCIAATAEKKMKFVSNPKSGRGDCQFEKRSFWPLLLIALLVLYFLIFLGLAFKLRKTMSPLNEFRLIRRGGILSLFLFLLFLVTVGTKAYDQPVGRCLLSAAVASAVFYYFWARNGVTVYNVLFHKQEYLDKFNAELRRSCSQHERDKYPRALLEMENQLNEIRAEVQQYKETIESLEGEVKVLELQYGTMQQRSPSQATF